jgi:hypothetical protein
VSGEHDDDQHHRDEHSDAYGTAHGHRRAEADLLHPGLDKRPDTVAKTHGIARYMGI